MGATRLAVIMRKSSMTVIKTALPYCCTEMHSWRAITAKGVDRKGVVMVTPDRQARGTAIRNEAGVVAGEVLG